MRFLVRAVLYFLLIGLAFRLVRALITPHRQRKEVPPASHPNRDLQNKHIEDANFTEIDER